MFECQAEKSRHFSQARNDAGFPSTLAEALGVVENERPLGLTVHPVKAGRVRTGGAGGATGGTYVGGT
jgi:hypothetical protein